MRHDCTTWATALMLGILGLTGCGANTPELQESEPPTVDVAHPSQREVTTYRVFNGRVQAVNTVELRARVSGYLIPLEEAAKYEQLAPVFAGVDVKDFAEGSDVKQGDILFQVDPAPYLAELQAALAQRAAYDAARLKAVADLARSEKLLPTGAISKEEYDQDKAELEVAAASVLQGDAAIARARLDVDYTTIRAPISGRVSRKLFDVGNLITVADGQSGVLTSIVSNDPIYVYFPIDENSFKAAQSAAIDKQVELEQIKDANIEVEVALEKGSFNFKGILDFVDNQVDQSTGTIMARAVLDNSERRLTPGLFVRTRIAQGSPAPQLLVDETAVGVDQNTRFVLVVNDKNEVETRRVQLGDSDQGQRVILPSEKPNEGVKPDDWVIVRGIQRVRPGQVVKPNQLADDDDSTEP